MIIGVTGKIGSGKSTVTKMLVDFGFRMINVDQLGHQALVSERERIVGAFGPEVVDDDGQIDRRHLSALIFKFNIYIFKFLKVFYKFFFIMIIFC